MLQKINVWEKKFVIIVELPKSDGTCNCSGNFAGSNCNVCKGNHGGPNCRGCKPGYYNSNGNCLKCAENHYCTGDLAGQQRCPWSQYSPKGSSGCSNCGGLRTGEYWTNQAHCQVRRHSRRTTDINVWYGIGGKGCFKDNYKGKCKGSWGNGAASCAQALCYSHHYTHASDPKKEDNCSGGWTYQSNCWTPNPYFRYE